MKNQDFMNESMDFKRLFLCFKRKMLLIIGITLAGALLGGGIYLMVRTISMPVQYQSRSQFYIQYIYDPIRRVEEYYNGYTWNDLLHSDPIIEQVVIALKAEPSNEKRLNASLSSDEELSELLRANSFKGEILSDRRLLTITFTTDFRPKTAAIQEAMETGLLIYADRQREIVSMELIRSTEPQLVIWDNHLHRAIIGGGVLFLLFALFGWWFYYILDDSLYVVADAEKRYPYPVIGILVKGETIAAEAFNFAETKENLAYLLKDKQNPIYLSVEKWPYPDGYDLRGADGVILEIPFGCRNGKKTDRCVSFLRNQDVVILGLIITEADERFLRWYYGLG